MTRTRSVSERDRALYGVGALPDRAVYRLGKTFVHVLPSGKLERFNRKLLTQVQPFGPLGGDLHSHLMGTGSGNWWVSAIKNGTRDGVEFWFDMENISHSLLPDKLVGRLKKAYQDQRAITAKQLMAATDLQTLEAAFEIRGPVPGEFTPTFVGTFALKDTIVRARPEILTELIVWNANRYRSEGVNYVEFSIGGDLLHPERYEALVQGIREAGQLGVTVRFLLAFNRERISAVKRPLRDTWRIDLDCAVHDQKLEAFMNSRARRDGLVVGFDVVGCESSHPFNPFSMPHFLSAFDELGSENSNFGVRIHMGEDTHPWGYFDGGSTLEDLHTDSISYGLATAVVLSHQEACRIRLGHECNYGRRNYVFGSPWLLDYITRLPDRQEIRSWFQPQQLGEVIADIPKEACLTSNYFLARAYDRFFFDVVWDNTSGQDLQRERLQAGGSKCGGDSAAGSLEMSQHPVKFALHPELDRWRHPDNRVSRIEGLSPGVIPVCMGTDDSGGIRGLTRLDAKGELLHEPFTLSGEFGRAVDLGLVTVEEIPRLAETSLKASFAAPQLKKELLQRFAAERQALEVGARGGSTDYLMAMVQAPDEAR